MPCTHLLLWPTRFTWSVVSVPYERLLLTDGKQLNDVLSLCVGLWAVKVANQKTSSKMYTYGVRQLDYIPCPLLEILIFCLVAESRNAWCARERRFSRGSVSVNLP